MSKPATNPTKGAEPMAATQTESEIAAFFDRCADKRLMTDFPPDERAKLDWFLSLWGLKPGDRVLEPGCGSGRLTAELACAVGPGGAVHACDLSPGMLALARARELPPQARLARESVTRVSAPDGWFDAVICMCVFPHFTDPDAVLAEFARVLRPGGRLWINHFEGSASLNIFHRDAAPEVADHLLPCLHRMDALMRRQGFSIVQSIDCPEHYVLEAVRAPGIH